MKETVAYARRQGWLSGSTILFDERVGWRHGYLGDAASRHNRGADARLHAVGDDAAQPPLASVDQGSSTQRVYGPASLRFLTAEQKKAPSETSRPITECPTKLI